MRDRRALAGVEALGLTEARVRGAIRTLLAVGFLGKSAETTGFRRTSDGWRRPPKPYVFGADYRDMFAKANARAAAARGGRSDAQAIAATPTRRNTRLRPSLQLSGDTKNAPP